MKKRYTNVLSKLEDLKLLDNVEYIVIYDKQLSYQDVYDTPPSTSTYNHLQVEAFENQEQLKEWIYQNVLSGDHYKPTKYKILRWSPVEATVQVSVADMETVLGTNISGYNAS